MPIFKEIWNFTSGANTWSEVYYSVASDLNGASGFTPAFLDKRLILLHPLNILRKIRVSNIAAARESVVISYNLAGQNTPFTGANPASITDAVVCNLVSTAQPSNRRLWLRGVTDGDQFRNAATGNDELRPGFDTLLKAWFVALQTNGYIILARIPPGSSGVIKSYADRVNGAAATGNSIVTLPNPFTGVVGDIVTFHNFNEKDLPGLKGKFRVDAIAGNTITVQYTTPFNANIVPAQGYVKKLVYYDTAIINGTKSNYSFAGGRKTKNVQTGSRGARSAVRIRART